MNLVWVNVSLTRLINMAFIVSVEWHFVLGTQALEACTIIVGTTREEIKMDAFYATQFYALFTRPGAPNLIPAAMMPRGRG